MKSAHQIASEIVDAWPYSVNVTTANRAVLASLIVDALHEQIKQAYWNGRNDGLQDAKDLADKIFKQEMT